MDIAEYVKANKIDTEPVFALWVLSDLKCRKLMIRKAAMRVRKNMKFGIAIPATYDEAVELNKINGNTYW